VGEGKQQEEEETLLGCGLRRGPTRDGPMRSGTTILCRPCSFSFRFAVIFSADPAATYHTSRHLGTNKLHEWKFRWKVTARSIWESSASLLDISDHHTSGATGWCTSSGVKDSGEKLSILLMDTLRFKSFPLDYTE
jgi:hypothetical protein